jgi:glycosyltransferase involved in cell wall biosynthesis
VHVAINGWFWGRPDTGSGQYLRRLLAALAALDDPPQLMLIVPQGEPVEAPAGVAVRTVPLPGRGHWAKLRFEQRAFPAAAAAAGADLAHVPYWSGPLRSPLPIVVTVHDLIPLILPAYRGGVLARLYTGLAAAGARGAAAVITDSEAARSDILHHLGLPAERVHAIHLAAGEPFRPLPPDDLQAAIHEKYNLPDRFVLYLGGYDVRKNVATLLQAMTYVREGTGGDVPLVLAGRMPERPSPRFSDVQGMIDTGDLGDVVRTIGWVEEDDAPALYALASVFAFPSHYEGFGLPALEAMACGTPVVAADVSSLPEVVGDAGYLVDPNDARAMAGAILAILLQDDLAGDLSRLGLAQAANFSWAKTAAETVAVYEAVLAEAVS